MHSLSLHCPARHRNAEPRKPSASRQAADPKFSPDGKTGASAIDCWSSNGNSLRCYSLRLNLGTSVLPSAQVNHEDSALPEQGLRSLGKTRSGNVIGFGFYQTRWGKRRRYRCQTCEKTFCSNTGTPYYRLQHWRTTFDQVATLSVEGLNKSSIAPSRASAGIQSIAGWRKPATAAVASTIKE